MDLLDFYRECIKLARLDLDKQKMLLPPDMIRDLCENHHRKHRSLADKLKNSTAPCPIKAIQKAFPRSGTEFQDFDALELAKTFAAQKVSALAVVTEKHFYQGKANWLTGVSHMVDLPVIRWDFIFDDYQLMQSRLWGADVIRVIVPLLDQIELTQLYRRALELELEVLWEVHSAADIERVNEFESSAVIYLDADDLTASQAQDALKNRKKHSPVLINSDKNFHKILPEGLFAGTVSFEPEN